MDAVIKNPLQRDGTSQQERLLKALLPENAKIDDRKIEEILSFAVEYSRLINYYNLNNEVQGNWACFYKEDPCVLLALLAGTDTDSIETAYKKLEEKINNYLNGIGCDDGAGKIKNPIPVYCDEIIDLIYSVAVMIQKACMKLPAGSLLRQEIIVMIKHDLHLSIIDSKLEDALVKLIGYDKGSIGDVNKYMIFIPADETAACDCTKAWQLSKEAFDCIFPDNSFTPGTLKTLFYLFFAVLVRIKSRAKIYFEECVAGSDGHQPHITLFLTFLYLFRFAIDHLNTLTRAHLLYYYEKVLCLHKQKEVPDKVHVIFELAKNFTTHLIEEGTLLDAGKDNTGIQMAYALVEEIVVNRASVQELKTVYIDEFTGFVHAAAKADSKKSRGETFDKDEVANWRPLGTNEAYPAEIGFALASPMLSLKEGYRAALLTARLKKNGTLLKPTGTFRFYYSSEDKWIQAEDFFGRIDLILNKKEYAAVKKLYDDNKDKFIAIINKIIIELKEAEKAYNNYWDTIIAYINGTKSFSDLVKNAFESDIFRLDAEAPQFEKALREFLDFKSIFLQCFNTGEEDQLDFLWLANITAAPVTALATDKKPEIKSEWPQVKVLLNNADSNPAAKYTDTRNMEITGVDIKVGVYGIKEVIVQNDNAILDPSKEITLFSAKPYTGSSFLVGNKEVFGKKLDFVGMELEWAGAPGDFANYYKNYITKVTNNSFYTEGQLLYNKGFQRLSRGILPILWKNRKTDRLILGYSNDTYNQYIKDFEEAVASTVEASSPNDTTTPNNTTTPNITGTLNVAATAGNETVEATAAENGTEVLDIIKANDKAFNLKTISSFERNPYLDDFTEYDVSAKRGFIRLNLRRDFLHDEYPKALLKLVAGLKEPITDPGKLVNVPYTPKLKNITLFYFSSESVQFGGENTNSAIEQFYHITPFGYQRTEIASQDTFYLLPQFLKAAAPSETKIFEAHLNREDYLAHGNLYIGLKDALPEQKVNILFQVSDGTGDNRFSPPDIEWSYLVNNKWLPFKAFEMQDHTRADESTRKSLLKSGIIEFSLPKEITSNGTTILNDQLLWLRAAAQEDTSDTTNSDAMLSEHRIVVLPDLTAVIAQAAVARFENHHNSLSHLAAPLPAKTISKFIDSRAAIKKSEQPFYSFDGRLPENDLQFYTRISERLRHKNRAICIWDYERLVLQQFPQLYKAKCLNHTGINESLLEPDLFKLREIAPGFVTVAVIPDIQNKNTANKLEPRAPLGLLDEIKLFLKKHTNLFVASAYTNELDYLQVLNPLYEQVRVKACVRFHTGLDRLYYKYVLNEDLKKFLSPWAYDDGKEISFGSVYQKSSILNFIEERKYVDVVLDFSATHYRDSVEVIPGSDAASQIIPTTSRSILTSFTKANPADPGFDHDINDLLYDGKHPCISCPE
ncbi:MAG: hypothetical protein QM791_12820 [Ferruginibacter sp.]